MIAPSSNCLTDRCPSALSPVDVNHLTAVLTLSASTPSDEFGNLNELHLMLDHCQFASHLLCKQGVLNDARILSLFVENGQIFGQQILTLISSNHDFSDILLTSCLVVAVCRPLTLMCLFSGSFLCKVAGIRLATASADVACCTAAPVGCELWLLTPINPAEVVELIQLLPDNQSLSDPLLTSLLHF